MVCVISDLLCLMSKNPSCPLLVPWRKSVTDGFPSRESIARSSFIPCSLHALLIFGFFLVFATKTSLMHDWPLRICILQLALKLWNRRLRSIYRQVSNIRRTLAGYKIVDHSDVVGVSPVGAAPTTSSFSTKYLAPLAWAKTAARRDEKQLSLGFGASYIRDFTVIFLSVWLIFAIQGTYGDSSTVLYGTCSHVAPFLNWIDRTPWGRITHLCVSELTVIGSDNGSAPTNPEILGTNFSKNFSEVHAFSVEKIH